MLPSAVANGVVPLPTVKRTYSQADLDAAVKDIRCGRLGTRRASVVYGIPRSTLRNKIYKLEAAEEQNGETPAYKKGRRGAGNVCISTSPLVAPVHDSPPSDRSEEGSSSQFTLSWDHLGQAAAAAAANSDWTHALWSSFMRQQQPAAFPADPPTQIGLKERSSDDKHASSQSPADSVGSGSGQQDWKRSRPKRGQYRRYDKDALDEAVKSVRRGEMSVHRAGSYYGVPHSTLEYKVKERNLLRAKKRAHMGGAEPVAKASSDGEASSAEGSLSAAEKASDAAATPSTPASDSILNLSSSSFNGQQQQEQALTESAP